MSKQLSDRQLAANRANAQKSTGPRTPEGKARSRMNSWKHGITAQVVVLDQESQPAFDRLLQNLRSRFQPADGYELELVDNIAVIHWHMRRLRFMESALLQAEIQRPGVGGPINNPGADLIASLAFRYMADHSNVVPLLNTQLNRLSRESARLHDTFLKMRSELPPLDPADSDPEDLAPGQQENSAAPATEQYLKKEPIPMQPAALSRIAAITYIEQHEEALAQPVEVALARAA